MLLASLAPDTIARTPSEYEALLSRMLQSDHVRGVSAAKVRAGREGAGLLFDGAAWAIGFQRALRLGLESRVLRPNGRAMHVVVASS